MGMGVEISYNIHGNDTTVLQILEHIFLSVYIMDLVLHFVVHGWFCLRNPWLLFDFALICTSLISYVMGAISNSMGGHSAASMQDSMGALLVMRMLRLFRLVRAIRFRQKALWTLVRGLLGSAGTITYTFLLILLI